MKLNVKNWLKSVALYLNPRIHDLPPSATADNPRLLYQIRQNYKYRVKAEMRNFRNALELAENPRRPRRETLYALYEELALDDQVAAQCRIAQATVGNAPFELYRGEQVLNDEKIMLQRPWFHRYLDLWIDTELWGHSLIEFNPEEYVDGEFHQINLIPREHVRPEYGEVLVLPSAEKGIPYRKQDEWKYLLEMGNPYDLGLYKILAIPVIRKKYADTDWSVFSEKFGMPFIVGKTTSRQQKELDEKAKMLANFGANSWALMDDQDEIQMLNPNMVGTAHYPFRDRLQDADDRIAKIINGQTGASDEKAWVGSAEVHERILNDFVKYRLTRIQFHINHYLLPFLVEHGYPLNDVTFKFTELMREEEEPREDTGQRAEESEEKKTPVLSLSDLYEGLHLPDALVYRPVPDDVKERIMERIRSGELSPERVDPALFNAYNRTLLTAMSDGADEDLLNGLDYRHRDYNLFRQLRRSAWEFSVAKALKFQGELAKAAGQDNYEQFAKGRNNLYNGAWMETEYRLGVANTQQAVKWQDIQERKEALPMLRYVTAEDERVRDSHAMLHGATKPVDDPFWDTYYPPNGYNCRCIVQQVRGPEQDPEGVPEDIPSPLKDNPGKSGKMFSRNHPYFADLPADELNKQVKRQASQLPVFDLVFQADKGVVRAHPFHAPGERAENELIGRQLAEQGHEVNLLPRIEDGRATPDAGIDELVADFKTPGLGHASIQKAIRNAAKQRLDVAVLHFPDGYDRVELRRALLAAGSQGYEVDVWVLAAGELRKISAEEMRSGSINL